jgi:Cu+-exporting ATPase
MAGRPRGSSLERSEVPAIIDRTIVDSAERGLTGLALGFGREGPATREACFHCGEPCPDGSSRQGEKVFCCQGCLVVHDLLAENGLGQFYELERHPGVRIRQQPGRERWDCLDAPALQKQLLDFTDGKLSRVTFKIPAIHCVACVWLLENLFRLHPGIRQTRVNFLRRELATEFAGGEIALSQVVELLASIGYEPSLTLGELGKQKVTPAGKRRWLQLGMAGFAFGNIMLLSIPSYLGLDSFSGPFFKVLFGYLSLAFAAPVLVYSASDYWRSAWLSMRQRVLTLEVPIALGLAALYAQSAFEIVFGRGEGYLDSLSGLVFFLLCGRAFQQKTHDRLVFDRDYRNFFPLSVMRRTDAGEESVAICDLRVGDRLRLRNGELLPADARLVSGSALMDYSFVTGESEPVGRETGDYLYAGGQQVGGAIEVETVKPVSQSYLASLWNHEAFHKDRGDDLNTLTNRYSRRFTRLVVAVAAGAALFWVLSGDAARGMKAFTSVLIVACPCALALATPFALGSAQRLLARIQIFFKNALVLERLAQVDAIVFDKTGTLTAAQGIAARWEGRKNAAIQAPNYRTAVSFSAGRDDGLTDKEKALVHALTRHSTHPHAMRIGELVAGTPAMVPGRNPQQPLRDPQPATACSFGEAAGYGISGTVAGHELRLGSPAWLQRAGVTVPTTELQSGSVSYLSIDARYRGAFVVANGVRPETGQLLNQLGQHYELALLSGDNERERERFRGLFGAKARLDFNQTPLDKLGFIRNLQDSGRTVMMVGDGLNDAGALKQSDVGVAVIEKVGTFSPASDVILAGAQVPRLYRLLKLARTSTQIVRFSFGISALYNLAGISIAAAGVLSPLICAVLMPLSSLSVVLFACGATTWAARREGIV